MKKVFLFFLLTRLIWAQSELTSPYLRDPEKAIAYVDSCAQFWLQTWDESRGGFYTNIDKYGNVISNWGTNKNMITQSRNAYGLIRAFMLTGNKTYLDYAESALAFLYEHAWDNTYGGWYSDLDNNGNPTSRYDNKSAFNQHYALLGSMAAYEATADTNHFHWLEKGYRHLEDYFWDSRDGFEGYFDETNYSGTIAYNKSFNATVDAVTTHLLYLYLLTQEDKYRLKLEELANEMINRLAASMDNQVIGFAEKYDSDWQINNDETMTIMGHVLKTAWCLARIYQIDPDEDYLPTAEKLITNVLENGYDHQFGGPYKDYNRTTGEMLMWGNPDTAKAWWQMEQAVVAGLQMFNLTADSSYLQMADESLDFFMKYFVDHDYGEVYENRTRYGTETWGENKGGSGKAGYHSMELGYYTYLYGKLFVRQEPVTLYYDFEAVDYPRDIQLYPLAIASSDLLVSNVEVNDTSYTAFSNTGHRLHLVPGVGGLFKVTFSTSNPVSIVSEKTDRKLQDFTIYPNYPNPFNSSTTIRYDLKHSAFVSINIYNIHGKLINNLFDNPVSSGYREIQWDGRDQYDQIVSSGIYYYQVTTPEQQVTGKCIFIK